MLFIASAGTGAAGLLLCVVMGVMYTLGFILASAGKLGALSSKLTDSYHGDLTGFVDFLLGEMVTVKANSMRTARCIALLRGQCTQHILTMHIS